MNILTETEVHEICRLLQEDVLSGMEIVNALKLYEKSDNPIALVSAIKNKKLWTNISDQYQIPMGVHGRVFNDNQIKEICQMLEHNPYTTSAYILYHLGIEPRNKVEHQQYKNTISMIKHRRRYLYISNNYSF